MCYSWGKDKCRIILFPPIHFLYFAICSLLTTLSPYPHPSLIVLTFTLFSFLSFCFPPPFSTFSLFLYVPSSYIFHTFSLFSILSPVTPTLPYLSTLLPCSSLNSYPPSPFFLPFSLFSFPHSSLLSPQFFPLGLPFPIISLVIVLTTLLQNIPYCYQ